jgi:triosephosphate isomerase
VVLCPPFPYLSLFSKKTKGVALGAQDSFWEQTGAFTGEVSPFMLKELGCTYCIVGHSERRIHIEETNDMIARKMHALLKEKIIPVLCVGETSQERARGNAKKVVQKQLLSALSKIPHRARFLVAYEPVWAIGGEKECSSLEASTMKTFIETLLKKWKRVSVLYGGSVNAKNASLYLHVGFSGVLVGGVSLHSKQFSLLIRSLAKITP